MFSGIALAALAAAQPASQQPLNLTCGGAGTANKPTAVNAYSNTEVYGAVGTTPVSGSGQTNTTVYGLRQQGFQDQVDIRLFGGDDRIRLNVLKYSPKDHHAELTTSLQELGKLVADARVEIASTGNW